MNHRITLIVLTAILLTGAQTCFAKPKKTGPELPEFSKVQQQVHLHFLSLYDVKQNDLLTKSQVKPVFKSLKLIGWGVVGQAAILNKVLEDQSFLAREMRTTTGKKVMRKISSTPGIYDLMHRMSWLRGGKKMVHQLIQLPDGAKTLKTLKTSKRGKQTLARLQKSAPRGSNLKTATGYIYTEKQLIERLKKIYDQEKINRKQK